jgi:hypothetical protein
MVACRIYLASWSPVFLLFLGSALIMDGTPGRALVSVTCLTTDGWPGKIARFGR